MSFKWNYIWQFSMLFGVFCQVTWHMVCKTCFCYCLGIQVGLLQMQLHHPFLGLGLHHPFFWARQDYGTPLHNQSFTIPKEKKKNTHTHTHTCQNGVVTLYDSWLGKNGKKVSPLETKSNPFVILQSWPETSDETLLDWGKLLCLAFFYGAIWLKCQIWRPGWTKPD
jgi:hypothetical protein